jgi:hypothetical protein
MADRDKTPPLTPAARARSQAERPPNVQLPAHEDGDTERRPRAGSHWDDDQRAVAGAAHRGVSTDSQRRRRAAAGEASNDGVPTETDWNADITSPEQMLDAALSANSKEAASRMRTPTDSPLNVRQGLNIVESGNRHYARNRKAIDDVRTTTETLANAVLEVRQLCAPDKVAALDARLDDVDSRVGKVEGMMKTIRIVIFLLIGGSGGYGIVIAEKIWDRAEREGESTIRLQHVERQLDDLTKQLREDISRRYPPAAERWLQPPSTQKDHAP